MTDVVLTHSYRRWACLAKPFNKEGISQSRIQKEGSDYVRREFPNTDFWRGCHVAVRRDPSRAAAEAHARAQAAEVLRTSRQTAADPRVARGNADIHWVEDAGQVSKSALPTPRQAPALYFVAGFLLTLLAFACGRTNMLGLRGRSRRSPGGRAVKVR